MTKEELLEIIKTAKEKNATGLFLQKKGIVSLPAAVYELTNLKVLNLSGNLLSAIPDGIGRLTNLRDIDLSNNQLTTLPSDIGELTNLTNLDLRENRFSEFPIELTKISSLKVLFLRDNSLSKLPHGIGDLTNLTNLDLRGNQLSELPIELTKISRLTFLYLRKNLLTNLPKELINLKRLRRIDLRDNLLDIPLEIVEKTMQPGLVFDYYFTQLSSPRRPLLEAKLILVGQGSVGKTSLAKRILGEGFNSAENKTEGIAIRKWSLPIDGHSISINIWDFGGQEIMHATHQFFLTKRSIYLLVLDSRLTQEENRVEYWLKIIQSFSDNSPVILVGNKTDQHPLDIDRTGLKRKYSNVVSVVETSAASGVGISTLKASISDQIRALPHIHDQLPESWFEIKAQIESLGVKENFIKHDEYVELCVQHGIVDEGNQNTLIGFLHDLGVVLHFQDDPRLAALGILNPRWVTTGVYKILNSHALFQNKGVLTLDLINDILNIPEYPRSSRLFIVEMMGKFELCYPIDSNQFLIPDLLPKDEPYLGEWDNALPFQYHYNVLPPSIISRFIVRMNAFVHKTVWRSGVVLKSGENEALVKSDSEDRKICIWITGSHTTRRDFLSAIRAQFEAIHRTMIKIEAHEKVPVPMQSHVVVDYNHLLKLEQKGINEYIPEGLDEALSVSLLLDGVASSDTRHRDFANILHAEREATTNIKSPAILASETDPKKNQPFFRRIMKNIFVDVPRIVGRVIVDLIGRDKASDSTIIILGYTVIAAVVLVVWSFNDFDRFKNVFKETWRFFFPVK